MRSKKTLGLVLASIILITLFTSSTIFATSEPIVTMEQVEKAIEWAYSQSPNNETYNGFCLRFVSDAFGQAKLPPPKRTTPYSCATEAADELLRFTDKNPPRGAVVFYNYWGWDKGVWKNLGHVAISLGNGNVIHYMNNKVSVTNIDIGGNVKYRGWGYWRDYEIKYLPDVEIKDIGQIAAGGFFTTVLKDDGTVWLWGRFTSQRDDDRNPNNDVPTKVLGVENVASLSAGFYYNVALKKDGTVWSWGDNSYGQLGDGTETERKFPVQANGLDKVVKIATGEDYTVALREDGTVWTWGRNEFAQLGDGSNNNRNIPTQVNAIKNVIEIYAGGRNTMVRTKEGKLWGWGIHYGEKPVQLPELAAMSAISIGAEHGLAIKHDGTVWSFGFNFFGERGIGTADRYMLRELTQVKGINRIVAVAAGNANSVALKEDGTVWAWGSSFDGKESITTPVQVEELNDVVAIATGLYRSHHIVANKKDGTVWSIGWNDSDQLGIGRYKDNRVSNIPVQSFINIKDTIIKTVDPSLIEVYREEYKINGREALIQQFYFTPNKSHYAKLRDIAMVLDGTERQFDVTFNEEKKITNIITNQQYTKVGGELTYDSNVKSVLLNISTIYKDNIDMHLITYSIDNIQYVDIMDLARILNFKIFEDPKTYIFEIDTSLGFNTEYL